MISLRRRTPAVSRAAMLLALGLVLAALPAPSFDFVERAVGTVLPFPATRDAAAAEVDAMRHDFDEADHDGHDHGALGGADALDDDRVVGVDESAEDFSMIGVRFDHPPSEPVLVRTRTDGAWGEWVEMEHSADHGPDPGGPEPSTISTEPVWVGEADGYEISVPEGSQHGASVTLVRDEPLRVVADAVPLAGASVPAPFSVQPRSAWNARAPRATSYADGLRMAVVHHTVNSNGYSRGQVPGILRSIQAYHMDSNGWSDIGYNFLVDRFGTVWEGRGGGITRPVIGAHAAGFNTGSVGVALIGDHTSSGPSSAALEGVARVVGWRLYSARIDPRSSATFRSAGSSSIPAGQVVSRPVVVGHRDVGATSCPGATTYSQLSWIRNRAKNWYDATARARNPVGSFDEARVAGRSVTVRGWAADPDSSLPVRVHVYVGDRGRSIAADRRRRDVAVAYPSFGDSRGYEVTFADVPAGTHKVCAFAINVGAGDQNPLLGCRNVVVK